MRMQSAGPPRVRLESPRAARQAAALTAPRCRRASPAAAQAGLAGRWRGAPEVRSPSRTQADEQRCSSCGTSHSTAPAPRPSRRAAQARPNEPPCLTQEVRRDGVPAQLDRLFPVEHRSRKSGLRRAGGPGRVGAGASVWGPRRRWQCCAGASHDVRTAPPPPNADWQRPNAHTLSSRPSRGFWGGARAIGAPLF
jgi:hypothetical protein